MSKKNISYLWGHNSLLIKLGNRSGKRLRALFVFEFLFMLGLATVFLVQSMPLTANYFHLIAGFGSLLLCALAVRRFLKRMFYNESILIENQCITLIKKTLFSEQVRRYDWRSLGALHYEGRAKKTDHPLKGKYFDYFGFESHEQLLQTLHQDGNLYFHSAKGRVYFAAGVYSWDAEEMVQMMKLYMGHALELGPEWAYMLQTHEFDDVQ
jgi:hypothetical protein